MENKFEIEGKLFKFGELKTFDSGYKKQDIIIELERKWNDKVFTDTVKFVVDKEKVDNLYTLLVGDPVKICFTLSGRMWNSPDKGEMNFTDLKVLWFQKIGATVQADPGVTSATQVADVESAVLGTDSEEDDGLPF